LTSVIRIIKNIAILLYIIYGSVFLLSA
jgi:hypothetical protein